MIKKIIFEIFFVYHVSLSLCYGVDQNNVQNSLAPNSSIKYLMEFETTFLYYHSTSLLNLLLMTLDPNSKGFEQGGITNNYEVAQQYAQSSYGTSRFEQMREAQDEQLKKLSNIISSGDTKIFEFLKQKRFILEQTSTIGFNLTSKDLEGYFYPLGSVWMLKKTMPLSKIGDGFAKTFITIIQNTFKELNDSRLVNRLIRQIENKVFVDNKNIYITGNRPNLDGNISETNPTNIST